MSPPFHIACDLRIMGVLVDIRGIREQRAAHDQPFCFEDFGSLDHNSISLGEDPTYLVSTPMIA